MPKKKINNRLNKLFEDITPEETASKPKRPPRVPRHTAALNPASIPLKPIDAQVTTVVSEPTPSTQQAESPVLAFAFQTRENDWATLRVTDESSSRTWSEEDQLLLRQVADQLSLALENAHLFQEEQKRAEELAVINDLVRELTTQFSLRGIAESVHKHASRLMDTNNFFLGVYNEAKQTLSFPLLIDSGTDIHGIERPLGRGLTDYVIRTKQSLYIPDNAVGKMRELGIEIQTVGDNTPALCWLGVPLLAGDKVVGAISVQSATTPNLYTAQHRDLLLAMASQAAIAIENARLFEEAQRRAREMATLAEVGQDVSASLDLQTVLERIASHAKEILGSFSSAVYLPEPDGQIFRAVAVVGDDIEEIKNDPIRLGEGILGTVALQKSGEIVNNALSDSRAIPVAGTQILSDEHLMAVPLLSGDRVRGIMAVWRTGQGREFLQEEFELLVGLSRQAAIAAENARLYDSAEYRASTENLVSQISSSFINVGADQVDAQINAALQKLGEFSAVDRAYLFRFSPDGETMDNTHEWARPGVEPLLQMRKGFRLGTYSEFLSTLENMGVFHIPRVVDLPQEAKAEKQELLKEGVLSILCVPLRSRGKIGGFIGFDSVKQEKIWPEQDINMLRLVGEIFTGALQRQQAEFENIRLLEATRQSEEAVTRSEAELRALFSAMNDVIIVLDRKGTYVRIAPTNPSRLFRPPEELLGKTIREAMPSYIHEPMMSAIEEAIKTGLPIQLEYWLEINGQTYWFDASFSKLNEEQAFLVARDITERKKAEELIRRRNEYLAASSEIGRTITSTLDLDTIFARIVSLVAERFRLYHAAIYTVEETGFNAVYRDGTGNVGEEMKKLKHRTPLRPNTVIGSVASMGEAVIVNNTTNDPLYKANSLLPETRSEVGIPLRVGTRVTGVLDLHSNQIAAFHPDEVAVLQTLADQVAIAIDNARSYELSQQAVREMREIDRLKSQFLANMSHELRTPLNSIIGFSRVILKGIDGPVTELQQQDLTAIYNSGQHLLALINDILDLAKIEAGKMELAFDEVNMGDVINSVLSTVTGLIKDKQITIAKNIQPDMPSVRADAIRIRQVLINLFSNAAKFTDEGIITVEASLQTSPSGRPEIVVGVTDTGPGIAAEDQAKLFQAFSQVDDSPTRKTGGTGLGLSISQNLVQMHGGRIGVTSDIGKGSTFYFALPVYRGAVDEPQTKPGGKIILAVDDDPHVIALYERYLQPQGYHVIAVTEPARTRERAIQLKPFAITLDIMMPGYDGWQVLNELKSDPETRDIPVVICSIIEDHEKGFSLGAADYLVKPILEEDLLHALDRLNLDNSIDEVLVVDDDPNDLRLMGKMLTDQGRYKPLLVEGGLKGWETIKTKPPQAVILDLFMPDMDGFTILESMRADSRLRDIPVIVITGGDLTVDQKNQLAEIGQRLLTKGSLNEKDLLASMEHALQRVSKK